VYAPLSTYTVPVSPPLILLDPNVTGVAVSLGANLSSAEAVVIGSNLADLVKNPDFFSSADQWYASPGNYLSVYWAVDSVGGSSGGTAEIAGQVPGSFWTVTTDSAFVWQPIRTPPATITSATMTVRYRLATLTGIASATYVFGVWDPAGNGGWAWYTTGSLSTSTTYTAQTFTVSNITGDKDYLVVAGIVVSTWLTNSNVDYYIDYLQLTIQTVEYTFSNSVIDLNVTSGGPYYAWLTVTGLSTQPDLNCNITLMNWTSYRSEPIIIENGSLITNRTSEVEIPAPPSALYVSGTIEVSMVKNSALNSTINLILTYCTLPGGGGACVSYPINLTLDPPQATEQAQYNQARTSDDGVAVTALKWLRIDTDEVKPLVKKGGG